MVSLVTLSQVQRMSKLLVLVAMFMARNDASILAHHKHRLRFNVESLFYGERNGNHRR